MTGKKERKVVLVAEVKVEKGIEIFFSIKDSEDGTKSESENTGNSKSSG